MFAFARVRSQTLFSKSLTEAIHSPQQPTFSRLPQPRETTGNSVTFQGLMSPEPIHRPLKSLSNQWEDPLIRRLGNYHKNIFISSTPYKKKKKRQGLHGFSHTEASSEANTKQGWFSAPREPPRGRKVYWVPVSQGGTAVGFHQVINLPKARLLSPASHQVHEPQTMKRKLTSRGWQYVPSFPLDPSGSHVVVCRQLGAGEVKTMFRIRLLVLTFTLQKV